MPEKGSYPYCSFCGGKAHTHLWSTKIDGVITENNIAINWIMHSLSFPPISNQAVSFCKDCRAELSHLVECWSDGKRMGLSGTELTMEKIKKHTYKL